MKLKLDENLPEQLVPVLRNWGHDVHSAREELLSGRTDGEIWAAAQSESRLLVTQDLDFADLRKFPPGAHAGLVIVRLRAPSRSRLLDRLGEILRNDTVDTWAGCFVVISDSKIRVVKFNA